MMTKTIAVAGKGGTGKTLVTALLIKYIVENRPGTVLAIDADPSTNLNLTLGVPIYETVGDIREETLQDVQSGSSLGGMSKPDYLDLRIQQSLVEERDFDLLAMGRPEGPGCYCAANNMLRLSIDRLSKSYDYVVIDNEAGLEHLSRRTTRNVDLLLLVSDPTVRSIITASIATQLIHKLKTRAEDIRLVINRIPKNGEGKLSLSPELEEAIAQNGLELIGLIPEDPTVGEYDAKGLPLAELPPQTPARRAVEGIIKSLEGLL
jgi:CO dehydrogenase maturation factor